MALLALGINHKTASVEVRERVAFSPDEHTSALAAACDVAGLSEVAILSTCNRTEIYCNAKAEEAEAVFQWLSEYHHLKSEDIKACSYLHWQQDAARHMMRVASGLDSLVLGEPQILGQLKSSFSMSQDNGFLGGELGRLFQQTFSVAKRVRTETAIGENPVSVAYAAVSLSQHIFADLKRSHALLIGAGETIELVARHLKEAGIKSITVANRTHDRALALAEQVDGSAVLLGEIPDVLPQADIVISSTASQLPILGKGAVETALKKRRHRPVFMVDIAVPRDIEPQVAELDDVYLYTVDDLKEVIEENQRSREVAAQEAETLVEAGASEFIRQLRSLDAVDTLTMLRRQAESIREAELEKALRQIQAGKSPEDVLTQMSRGITNKLIHQPTIQMRRASADGRSNIVEAAHELYQLGGDDQADKKV